MEGSLERLGIDQIDLYYQHRVDRTMPIEETWAELKVLIPLPPAIAQFDGATAINCVWQPQIA